MHAANFLKETELTQTVAILELEEVEGTENSHPSSILYLAFFLSNIISNATLLLSEERVSGSNNDATKLYMTLLRIIKCHCFSFSHLK